MYSSLIEDMFIFSAENIKKSENIVKHLPPTLVLELDSYLEKLRQLVFRNLSIFCIFCLNHLENCKYSYKKIFVFQI